MKRLVIFTTFLAIFPIMSNASAVFFPLGDISGSEFFSIATGVSDNGRVVTGWSRSQAGTSPYPGYEAFRWTETTGIQGLGFLPSSEQRSHANEISGDGSTIVGYSGTPGSEATQWTESYSIVGLGDIAGGSFGSEAFSVSGDGSVIVGRGFSDHGEEALIWYKDGTINGLGDLPDGIFQSRAQGISRDGTVVVGWGTTDIGRRAFRWTDQNGMEDLGNIDSSMSGSFANDVSDDGRIVVGQGRTARGIEAFLWQEGIGMVGLGDLSGGNFLSSAMAVTADGTTIVGTSYTDRGEEAFIWDRFNEMRLLQDVLIHDYGLDLNNWILQSALDISGNGNAIVGFGINPDGNTEAWLVSLSISQIPEPSTIVLFLSGYFFLSFSKRRSKSHFIPLRQVRKNKNLLNIISPDIHSTRHCRMAFLDSL